MNILLGVTGSVATIKLPELIESLRNHFTDANLKVVATQCAAHFISADFYKDFPDVPLLTDSDEWNMWKNRGDPVLHIELRKWADIMIVAPMDANTMAKAANGLCDNLLTCILLAWDFKNPILASPAMNTAMWDHPITSAHMTTLRSFGYRMIDPIEKTLICGDQGVGAMAEVSKIIERIQEAMEQAKL